MACPNKQRVRFMEQLERKHISVFIAEVAQTATLTSDSPCLPELKQYENLRETGKDVCLCAYVNLGKNKSSVILHRMNDAHTHARTHAHTHTHTHSSPFHETALLPKQTFTEGFWAEILMLLPTWKVYPENKACCKCPAGLSMETDACLCLTNS